MVSLSPTACSPSSLVFRPAAWAKLQPAPPVSFQVSLALTQSEAATTNKKTTAHTRSRSSYSFAASLKPFKLPRPCPVARPAAATLLLTRGYVRYQRPPVAAWLQFFHNRGRCDKRDRQSFLRRPPTRQEPTRPTRAGRRQSAARQLTALVQLLQRCAHRWKCARPFAAALRHA